MELSTRDGKFLSNKQKICKHNFIQEQITDNFGSNFDKQKQLSRIFVKCEEFF